MDDRKPELTPADAERTVEDVLDRIREAAIVDRQVLESILAALFARGHVLLEDVPGTGKSVTARVLAEAMGLEFTRIQFTPDLLPSDVTGSLIYNEHDGEFEFSEGPIFTNVVLADEINRAPPKTQAALLEAMEERQVSVDGTTYDLPRPFLVIATQNPVEQEGTFRLPEAQRDRFSVKTSFGYPDVDGELELLDRRANRRSLSPSVEPVIDQATVCSLQALLEDVEVDEKIRRYIIDLARITRTDARAAIGVSPRGVQRIFETTRSLAVFDGRSYVTPEDVKRLATPMMAHRIVLTTDARVEGVDASTIVDRAMNTVDVPGVAPDGDESDRQDEPVLLDEANERRVTAESHPQQTSASHHEKPAEPTPTSQRSNRSPHTQASQSDRGTPGQSGSDRTHGNKGSHGHQNPPTGPDERTRSRSPEDDTRSDPAERSESTGPSRNTQETPDSED